MDDEEMFATFLGMEEANRIMVAEMEAAAPRCHMRPMMWDQTDGEYPENFWECSVCGHTKPI